MSWFSKLFEHPKPRYKGPDLKVPIKAHPLTFGESSANDVQLLGRLEILFRWHEQKAAKATPEKLTEMKEHFDKTRYALAGRGYPLITTYKELEELTHASSNI